MSKTVTQALWAHEARAKESVLAGEAGEEGMGWGGVR